MERMEFNLRAGERLTSALGSTVGCLMSGADWCIFLSDVYYSGTAVVCEIHSLYTLDTRRLKGGRNAPQNA